MENKKPILAALAGFFDPSLRELAQKLAASIPENSPLKHQSLESALGALKGLVETLAEQLPPVAGVMVEKATDFSDFLAGALNHRPELNLEKWASEVLKDAGERLRKAQDPTAELERIKLELQLRKQLVELVRKEMPPPPPSQAPKLEAVFQSWTDDINCFNAKLERKAEKIRKWAQKRS